MKNISIKNIFKKILETWQRFPSVCFVGTIASILAILKIQDGWTYYLIIDKVLMICVLSAPLFFSISVFGTQRHWSRLKIIILQAFFAVLLSIYYFLYVSGGQILQAQMTIFYFLLTAFFASIVFAPFILQKKPDEFYQHCKSLLSSFISTLAYTGTLFIGLNIIILTINFLFKFGIDPKIHMQVWVFIVGIISLPFFLANIPRKIKLSKQDHVWSKFVKPFSLYVLLPVLSIYLIILYVYAFKIVLTSVWPQGTVAYLVLCFSTTGIFVSFLLYPIWQNKGKAKNILKFFYALLIPLIGLLFWAIQIRISEFGITEKRYLVVILGLWLLGLCFYFIFSKKQNLKIIFYSIFVILILSCFGPWGAVSISKHSQIRRLENILIESKILIKNKIQKDQARISDNNIAQVRNIIQYLNNSHSLESIQSWFEQDLDQLDNRDSWRRVDSVMSFLGIESGQDMIMDKRFMFSPKELNFYDINGYDYLAKINKKNRIYYFQMNKNNFELEVYKNEQMLGALDLKPLAEKLVAKHGHRTENWKEVSMDDLIIEQVFSGVRFKIYLEQFNFIQKESSFVLNYLDGFVLIDE